MRVIAWKRLREFAGVHPAALEPLKVWTSLMKSQSFAAPSDVKRAFGGTVDFLPDGVVVFDIGGNKYRLSVNITIPLRIGVYSPRDDTRRIRASHQATIFVK